MNHSAPDHQHEAPGRIPESLIDAVLDGSVDERTRREVARALRHDPSRRDDVVRTLRAIDAMRSPIECPDFSGPVLASLDRRHRLLSPGLRRSLRQARLGLAAAAMITLVGAAVAQRAIPRLASIGTPATPVSDIACAVQSDAATAADGVIGSVRNSVGLVQASLPGARSLSDALTVPGKPYRVSVDLVAHQSVQDTGQKTGREAWLSSPAARSDRTRFLVAYQDLGGRAAEPRSQIFTVRGTRCVIVESNQSLRFRPDRGGVVGLLTIRESASPGRSAPTDHIPDDLP